MRQPYLSIRFFSLVIFLTALTAACSRSGKKEPPKGAVIARVTFLCEGNRSVKSVFRDGSVSIDLSDGRSMTLKQVISASGARYANKDESFVFWNKGNTAFITEADSMTYKNCVAKGEDDLVNLNCFEDKKANIALSYPQAFQMHRKDVPDTLGWSYSDSDKGELVIQLRLPRSYQPKTNFSEATFTVGRSKRAKALEQCLEPPRSPAMKADTVAQNEIQYLRTRYTDAGAGNYYQISRYRTRHGHYCYSIEQMVHYTNIHNYPSDSGIAEFDSARVQKMLTAVMNTVHFID